MSASAGRRPEKFYNRHFGRRENTDGRPPRTRAPADIERRTRPKGVETGDKGIEKAGDKPERKYLAVMDMPRKLEIEKAHALRIHHGPVLEEEGKVSF